MVQSLDFILQIGSSSLCRYLMMSNKIMMTEVNIVYTSTTMNLFISKFHVSASGRRYYSKAANTLHRTAVL